MQAVSVRVTLRFLIAACLSIGMVSAGAEPSKWNAIGTLECTAGASLGLAGGGRQRARCSFNTEKLTANYTGRFERVDRLAGIPSGSNCGGPYWHQRAVRPATSQGDINRARRRNASSIGRLPCALVHRIRFA